MTDCPNCYAYEQEIAQLKAQLQRLTADVVPVTPVTPMATVAGLTRQQEAILTALWKAQGGAIRSHTLSAMLGGKSGKASVRVQLCRIRDKIGDDSIANSYRRGYYLTATGLEKLNTLMETTK